jgi:hypothetical protein
MTLTLQIVSLILTLALAGAFGAGVKRVARSFDAALEAYERIDHRNRQERRELAVRIQTPELAPAVAFEPVPGANQAARFDDDADFHEKVTT